MTAAYLLDTHLLLWLAGDSSRASPALIAIVDEPSTVLLFSSVSIWEVAIKASLGRDDFHADPSDLAVGLESHGYRELPVTALHAARVATLPPLHRDPFDRMLVAQSLVEDVVLLTHDPVVGAYPARVELV